MLNKRLQEVAKLVLCPAASGKRFDRPIFILAPPRSGSTLLHDCMTQFEGIFRLRAEADFIWWRHFPYQDVGYCDSIPADQLPPSQVPRIYRHFYREAVIDHLRRRARFYDARYLIGLRAIRYLDKTIANCFHLELLARLFPDAQYVFLVRDPCANIASMIEGWRHLDRFGKPQLTSVLRGLANRTIEHWSYPAPPGWQEIVHRPLGEICAWSWLQHVTAVLDFCERRRANMIQVRYEDLTLDATGTVHRLADLFGLGWTDKVAGYTRSPPLSETTVSKPHPEKWKRRQGAEIERVLPLIERTATRIGYKVALA